MSQHRLIVDAMNVIGSRPDGWWRDRPAAIVGFAQRLRTYAHATATPVTVVIDGRPLDDLPERDDGALRVVYATRRGPDAADDRIVELLDEAGGAPRTVVTADRDLRERVEARGAEVVGPRELLARLDDL